MPAAFNPRDCLFCASQADTLAIGVKLTCLLRHLLLFTREPYFVVTEMIMVKYYYL